MSFRSLKIHNKKKSSKSHLPKRSNYSSSSSSEARTNLDNTSSNQPLPIQSFTTSEIRTEASSSKSKIIKHRKKYLKTVNIPACVEYTYNPEKSPIKYFYNLSTKGPEKITQEKITDTRAHFGNLTTTGLNECIEQLFKIKPHENGFVLIDFENLIYKFKDKTSIKSEGLSKNNEVISQTSVLLTQSILFFERINYTPIFIIYDDRLRISPLDDIKYFSDKRTIKLSNKSQMMNHLPNQHYVVLPRQNFQTNTIKKEDEKKSSELDDIILFTLKDIFKDKGETVSIVSFDNFTWCNQYFQPYEYKDTEKKLKIKYKTMVENINIISELKNLEKSINKANKSATANQNNAETSQLSSPKKIKRKKKKTKRNMGPSSSLGSGIKTGKTKKKSNK